MKNLMMMAVIAIASIHGAFAQGSINESSIPANSSGITYQVGPGDNNSTKVWTYPYGVKLTVFENTNRNFEIMNTYKEGYRSTLAFRNYDGGSSSWTDWKELLYKGHNGYLNFKVNSAYSSTTNNFDGDLIIQSNATAGNDQYGGAISFSKIAGGDNKMASIAAKQTTTDGDNIGLSFFTHGDFANQPTIERMIITGDGKIGMGTTSPAAVLHVKSTTTLGGTSDITKAGIVIEANGAKLMMDENEIYSTNNLSIGAKYNKPMTFNHVDNSGSTERMRIAANGNIGIGVDNPTERLSVAGTIHSEKVVVDPDFYSIPDYVFAEDYQLQPLSEVKAYIKENKHLPEVPSASEMVKNGLELKEMSLLLLKKIEEMTLHQIELMEEVERLKTKVSELEGKSE